MTAKLGKTEPLIQALLSMKDMQLPFRTAYKMTSLLDAAEKHRAFYNAELKKLLDIYAKKDENGNLVQGDTQGSFSLKEDTIKEAGDRFDELMNLEVDFPDITFEEYELDSLSLSMMQVNALIPFISRSSF